MRLSGPTLFSIIAGGLFVVIGLYYVVAGFTLVDGIEMSQHGWIALVVGVIVSLLVGGVLSAILIISRRRGFDEGVYEVQDPAEIEDSSGDQS